MGLTIRRLVHLNPGCVLILLLIGHEDLTWFEILVQVDRNPVQGSESSDLPLDKVGFNLDINP